LTQIARVALSRMNRVKAVRRKAWECGWFG
jgi:hypothetical protein